jgi:hypothetical protein
MVYANVNKNKDFNWLLKSAEIQRQPKLKN